MGYGLGKESPIVLSLGKNNFEALVGRHGQWLRWRVSKKCPCVTTANEPDIHCEKCGGSGDIYDYQRSYEDIFRATVRNLIIEVPEVYAESTILEVYDSSGNQYQFCRCGDFIQINGGPRPLGQNELVDVRFRDSIVKHLDTAALQRVGGGYYRVSEIITPPSKLEGVYYQAEGDVISVESVKDSEGNSVEVLGYRQNMIYVGPEIAVTETLTASGIDYILPFKFIVLSQEANKADADFVKAHNGDAVCTYPYMYGIAENDVLTVLSGTMPGKIVMTHISDESDDIIPEFFITKIDSLETKEADYFEGVDFILTGTNRLHWIGRRPAAGEAIAINYKYRPTYRVAKNIPQLRTSEDQRIPRKVVLKLFSAFQESRKVNQNG